MLARIRDWQELPRAPYNGEHDKPETYRDGIFFNKADVKVGTKFTHYGRRNSPTTWIVHSIWTITGSGRDRVKSRVFNVRTLADFLEIRCEETGEYRTINFTYVCYSAIWRMES